MSSVVERQQQVRAEQLNSIPAKRLQERLKDIPSQHETLERRWFWELLQNANDVAGADGVAVKLTILPDKVVFQHNGRPFKPIEAENLIKPDSDKDDDAYQAKSIGQFGTGFISTHILSARIDVEGTLETDVSEEPYQSFRFSLDRTQINDKQWLKESISRSVNELDESFKPIDQPGEWTKFTYFLDKGIVGLDPNTAVLRGLDHLQATLPYVLALMPKVKLVEINQHGADGLVERKLYTINRSTDQQVFQCRNEVGGDLSQAKTVWTTSEGENTLLTLTQDNVIVPYPSTLPRLFYHLPLVGSEDFPSPVVIHSAEFTPKTERNGIALSDQDTKNRTALEEAVKLFSKHLEKLTNAKVEGLHNITTWHNGGLSGSELDWANKQLVSGWSSAILNAKLVRSKSTMHTLAETAIPYVPRDRSKIVLAQWDTILRNGIESITLPDEDLVEAWYDASRAEWGKRVHYPLTKMIEAVAKHGSLMAVETGNGSATWLKGLIQFALEHQSELLNEHAVIPDGMGRFRKREALLRWDRGLSQKLLDIHELLTQESFLKHTLHTSLNGLSGLKPEDQELADQDLCKAIDEAFKKAHDERGSKMEAHELKALQAMFKWSAKHDQEARTHCSWFYGHKATLYLHTFTDDQKDQAFTIVSSGKSQELSKLAESSLTKEDLDLLATDSTIARAVIAFLRNRVDDETQVDEETGLIGEEIVYERLRQRFPAPEYEVTWASKETNEPRFDFEIKRGRTSHLYVDAKTTKAGTANTDSVPFFMRMAQWKFLATPEARIGYEIARVFLNGDQPAVKWLRVSLESGIPITPSQESAAQLPPGA